MEGNNILKTTIDITIFELRIVEADMDVASYETVGRSFKREKMVQTVTWLSGLPKEFAIWLVNESVYVNLSCFCRRQ